MIEVTPATMDHASAIKLRPGDAAEIAALGLGKMQAFEASLARSVWADAYLVVDETGRGEVGAIMGLAETSLLGGASPWLMTGLPVDRCRKSFMTLTRARTWQMLAEYGTLVCNVHADYAQSVQWLRWLGFELAPARPFGPLGALFHEATLRAQ